MTITRPDLSDLAKNLNWVVDGESLVEHAKNQTQERLRQMAMQLSHLGGATGLGSMMTMQHLVEGSLVCVSQEVSRALEASKITAESMELIPWPANRLEIAWEDPGLPNMLLQRFEPHENTTGKVAIGVLIQKRNLDPRTGERTAMTLSFQADLIDRVLVNDFGPEDNFSSVIPFDAGLEPAESEAMSYMTILALKVLAFASVPEVKPSVLELKTKADRKAAGALSRGRESPDGRQAWHVRTLPRVASDRPADPQDAETESKRKFLGRIGHIRYFRSDFYVKLKGTWKWMPPIAPPEGIKLKFIIKQKHHGQ